MPANHVLKFENRLLRLEIDTRQIAFDVTDKSTGVVWRMASAATQDVTVQDAQQNRTQHALAASKRKTILPARHGLPGAYVRLSDLGLGIHIFLAGSEVTVEIERLTGQGPVCVRDVLFPRHFLLPKRPGTYSCWTVGQGSIVPATTTSRFHHPEGYSEQEMAWHGAFSEGSGFIAIAETPYDLYVAMSHLPKEAPATFIHWVPSQGDLRYTRRVRYTFAKGLDFVKQAKLYREYMKQQGFFVSLAEKARWNPNVAKLKGAVVVNALTCIRRLRQMEYVCNKFSEQAEWAAKLRKTSGIENAIVHVDGWGKFGYDAVHPEVLPPNAEAGGAGALKAFREKVRELGWLFGLHDQYIDIYKEAPSYDPSRLMIRENGKPNVLNVWAGGLCSHLCASESLKFVRRNYIDGVRDQYMYHNSKPIFELCDPDASYLDCFCRIQECFNPLHPLTRAETAHYTRECLRTVREHGKGVVQSCEHPKFYAVPDLDFAWGVTHMKADVQVVGGGNATEMIGIPVPLWHLVFHDALWLPEWGNDYATMFLYATGASFRMEKDGVPSAGDSALDLQTIKKVCALNKVAGFDEMTNFQVRDDGASVQSEFASGVRVTLNRPENTYRIQGPRSVATQGTERLP